MYSDNKTPESFTITPAFEKGKKTVNTAKVIAEQLNKCVVRFATDKKGIPTIWIKLNPENPENKEFSYLAQLAVIDDDYMVTKEYEAKSGRTWRKVFAKNPFRSGAEWYLFEHLTDSAEELVYGFIKHCIEEYEKEIENDSYSINVSVSFSKID